MRVRGFLTRGMMGVASPRSEALALLARGGNRYTPPPRAPASFPKQDGRWGTFAPAAVRIILARPDNHLTAPPRFHTVPSPPTFPRKQGRVGRMRWIRGSRR
jgi:hypothetical protein